MLRTRLVAALAATVLLATTGGDGSSQELPPGPALLERAPYLQNVTPTSAVVRWRTVEATTTRAGWGLAADALDVSVEIPGERTEHEVVLTGLPPDTAVFYAVGSTEQDLAGADADHGFATPPPAGQRRPIRIWVTGDHGTCGASPEGCSDPAAVRDGFLAWAGDERPDLWLMLGDNAYESGTDAEYTAGHFGLFAALMRRTPFWSAPGNHEFSDAESWTDSAPYYDSHSFPTAGEGGGVPSGTEAYYSFDWGNLHVVSLDLYATDREAPADPTLNVCPPEQGGAMYRWLCADLAANQRDFVVAIFHHPPYSKGSHDSDAQGLLGQIRAGFLPVFERFGVDVVLAGHSHSYERSVLLNGHYGPSQEYEPKLHALDAGDGDPDGDGAYEKPLLGPAPHAGTVYVVTGNASKISGGPLDHPVMARSLNVLGSVVIDVVGRQLDGRLIGVGGVELDHFRIVKGERLPACSDGVDQDGDGKVDYPADPGCVTDGTEIENPSCDDGFDNDGDGRIDWDGAGSSEPDAGCLGAWWFSEIPGSCGLGAELAIVVLPLLAVWRRRARS